MKRHLRSRAAHIGMGVAIWVTATSVLAGNAFTGRASVLDAGTIKVEGQRVLIWGVEAPRIHQMCRKVSGVEWRCGHVAATALSDWVGSRTVQCTDKGTREGRPVARCAVDGADIGQWLIANGWALIRERESKREYSQDEEQAGKRRKGIHAGQFERPDDVKSR